jgi:tetratricopeptide (TPR) repeat protein
VSRFAGLAAFFFGMNCARSGDDKLAPPLGELLGFEQLTLASVFDAGKRDYLLYPEAPLAKELKILPGGRTAIIDSGILTKHPQIEGLVVAQRDWTGEGMEDVRGHGTVVALGVVYGMRQQFAELTRDGPLKDLTPGLIIAKVAPKNGGIELQNVIDAIHWVVKEGATVVNLSLGFSGEAKNFTELTRAIEAYPEVLFYAAAGNRGPHHKMYPAACEAKNLTAVAEQAPTSGKGDIIAKNIFAPIPRQQYDEIRQQIEQFDRAQAFAHEELMEEANSLLLKIAQTPGHPRAAAAWFALGRYELKREAFTSALADFAEAAKLAPANAAILAQMGAAYFNKGDFAEAEKVLRQSVNLDDSRADVQYTLGLTYLRLSKFRSALAQFRATHRLDPQHPELAEILTELQDADARGELPEEKL